MLLFFFTSISFSQYFYIGELESDNQSDTMELFDLWMSATKEVVGKDLNMVTFQKELSNTHFFVRTYESLQQWVDEDSSSDELGAQVFQKLSGVEGIQEKYMAMQDYLSCSLNTVTWLLTLLCLMRKRKNISIEELFFMI